MKISNFVGSDCGINKDFFSGIEAVYKILMSNNFIYKKAGVSRISDIEGILAYLKSKNLIENCGMQFGKDIVKNMREDFGLNYFFTLNIFYKILKYYQVPLMEKRFSIDSEIEELINFIKKEQDKTKLKNYSLHHANINQIVKRLHFYGEDIQEFIRNCAIFSYAGNLIKIDTSFEERSAKKVDYYEFKARADIESLEDFKLEEFNYVFIKNGLTHSLIWEVANLKDKWGKNLFLFYDECPKDVETGLKNLQYKKEKINVYPFRMGKQFFIDEIFNVLSVMEGRSDCIYVSGAGQSMEDCHKSFNHPVAYSKQNLRLKLINWNNSVRNRISDLKDRMKETKDLNKITNKIKELEGDIFKVTLNNEDIFKYKGIEEKIYSICHFFKAMSGGKLCYSQKLMIPKIYNFLDEKYNETHSSGFYILKQGFYKILEEMFKDMECDLYPAILNAKIENDIAFEGKDKKDFFEDIDVVPLDYYIKSLEIVNSLLKELSRGQYIIT